MGFLIILLFIALFIGIVYFVSWIISRTVYRALLKKGNQHANALRVLTFILTACIVIYLLFVLIITTIPFGRR